MLRFLTAGESHGPALSLIIEGLPAGMPSRVLSWREDLMASTLWRQYSILKRHTLAHV